MRASLWATVATVGCDEHEGIAGSVPCRRRGTLWVGLAMAVDGRLDIAGEVVVHGRGGVLRHKRQHFGDPAPRRVAGAPDSHRLAVLLNHYFRALPHFL